MSADDDESGSERTLRTVTPSYHGRPDREMTLIGWAYFLGLLIVLLPLLPFAIILWLVSRLLDAVADSGEEA
ncbi:DUF7535 family protein [Salinilacihabitans rarus]|uniref:DUF7535 family protein n=1 Tax=Salinilacihabitans rarus TaxID=2961596 RepID=UPI0020C85A85|nr:hypothetical protein [Salinilacihabitans rarus]